MKPGVLAMIVYLGVIGIYLIPTFISPVLFFTLSICYDRNLSFCSCLFHGKGKRKWVTCFICIAILALGTWSNMTNIAINYDESNMKQIEYI